MAKVRSAFVIALQFCGCLANIAECSDSLGSCGGKPASLMQVKSMGSAQKVETVQASEIRTKLASFQKFTDELVAKYGGGEPADGEDAPVRDANGHPADKNVLVAVETVLKFIDQMYDTLKKAHKDDVDLVAECTDEAICKTCKNTYVTTDIVTLIEGEQEKVEHWANRHSECRAERKSQCQAVVDDDGACARYDNYRQNDGKSGIPMKQYLPSCARKGGDDEFYAFSETSIQADATTEEDTLEQMEECLVKTEEWFTPLWELYDQCERQTGACQALEEACLENQTHFEHEVCKFSVSKQTICENYETCTTETIGGCRADCDRVTQRAGARAADHETGERLKCLLEVLFGKYNPDSETGVRFDVPRPDSERPDLLEKCKEPLGQEGQWAIECAQGEAPDCGSTDVDIGTPLDCHNFIVSPFPLDNAPCDDKFLTQAYTAQGMQTSRNGYSCAANVPQYACDGFNKLVGQCLPQEGSCLQLNKPRILGQ